MSTPLTKCEVTGNSCAAVLFSLLAGCLVIWSAPEIRPLLCTAGAMVNGDENGARQK